ncbi:MAG: hypothetical protein ACREBF_04960 [Candidatus Micrarchaeales archaeon]
MATNDSALKVVSEKLWKEQSEKNWADFAKALKKSSAKRYRVVYEPGHLKTLQDLKKSYAELYDNKHKLIAKVPIFKMIGTKMRGTTIYLKDLLIINKV